jgi:2,4-dienoyl-CoA reductase-like NADH-dependent reductase (Old Yellow Enzyme family)
VAFGKLLRAPELALAIRAEPAIANPDLPRRFAESAPLNQPGPTTLYSHGPEGYIDQPSLETVADR